MNLPQAPITEIHLKPIGVVSSPIKEPILVACASDLELRLRWEKIRDYELQVKETVSDLIIAPQWEELLDGIEEFSHVLVLYWPHLIDPAKRMLSRVHPMGRKDLPEKGIFATCSPARPNPVLVSAVPLLEKKKNVIRVLGLEAVDGSPILDIKPYVTAYYGVTNPTVAPWMEQLHRELEFDISKPTTDS